MIAAVSFSTNPWERSINYTPITNSHKNNTFGGTKYVSINDINFGGGNTNNKENYDSISNFKRSPSGNISTSGVCNAANEYYVKVGGYYECLDSCPSHLPKYSINIDGSRKCVESCQPGDKTVYQEPNACIPNDCDDYGSDYYHWISTSSNICSSSCRDDYSYRNGTVCVNECPQFIQRNGAVNSENTSGICVSSCATSKFRLVSSNYKYSHDNTTVQQFCLDSCDKDSFTKYYIDSSINHCVDDCRDEVASNSIIADRRYMTNQGAVTRCDRACPNNYVRSVREFGRDTPGDQFEDGVCTSSCTSSEYVIQDSQVKYSDNSAKIYCVTACPTEYDKEFTSGGSKYCTDSCANEETNIVVPANMRYYYTSGGKTMCTAKCPSSHSFVVSPVNFDDSLEYGGCSTDCLDPLFITDQPDFTYQDGSAKKYCLDGCSLPQLLFRYSSGGKNYCVPKCPGSHAYLTNPTGFDTLSESGECNTDCNAPLIILDKPDFTYQDGSAKKYCLDDCSIAEVFFFYALAGKRYCLDSCDEVPANNMRYRSTDGPGLKECLDKCPVSIRNTTNFNSALEGGVCESNCAQYTLQSPNLIWGDNSLKTYCIPNCESLTTVNLYLTPDDRCVANCQDEGYIFTMKDKTCSNTCVGFILNSIYCVTECPEEYPFVFESKCLMECPEEYPFLLNFTNCVSKCPTYSYEEFCVEECNSITLIEHFSNQNRSYQALPFILSTGECAVSCLEAEFKFINELSNECMSSCPPSCSELPCPYEKLKYKDEKFYCRESCTDPEFPFRDDTSFECLSYCHSERPFIHNSICIEECPRTHSLVAKRANCEDSGCDSDCESFNLFCSQVCPTDLPFRLNNSLNTECVCKCPLFHEVEKGECTLKCDAELGLIPNSNKDSCNHCFRDLDKTFLYQGECMLSCPLGTTSNENYVCKTCLEVNLWTNELLQCIPFHKCYSLSHFDYENQICTRCDLKGYMITKRREEYACEETDCAEGHVSSKLIGSICVFCQPTEFFADPHCVTLCPVELTYNFQKRVCMDCNLSCGCCVNGTCRFGKCECKTNWTGKHCDVPEKDLTLASNKAIDFLNERLINNYLTSNENESIMQIIKLYYKDNSRRLLIEDSAIFRLMTNIKTLLLRQRVQFAYQPALLATLDKLIVLSFLYDSKTGDREMYDNAARLLYSVTNDVQLFNTTMSVVPDFTVVTSASFTGEGFNFFFGTDVSTEDSIDLTTCLDKLRTGLSLSKEHKFPYRLITFQSEFKNILRDSKAFIILEDPLIMVWLYLPSGIVNLDDYCQEKFIDLNFQVYLPETSPENDIQTINATGVDVFNKEDPFFNDRCVAASDGSDITISKRKERFFVDSSVHCKETRNQVCRIQEVTEGNKASCICKGIQDSKKSTLESTFSSYPKSNYILFTCLSIFKKSSLLRNMGFYTISIPLLLALFLIYYFNKRIDRELTDIRRFRYMRTDIEVFDSSSMDHKIYFTECINLKRNMSVTLIQAKKDNLDKFDYSTLPTLPDLNQLSVEEQMEFDTRSTWRFFIDTLLTYNTLAYTLFSTSLTDPKPFLILLYFSELNLGITLNSFFIDDDLVDSFNENEEHSLFSSFAEELPKTIWAMLTSKILMSILTFFYSFNYRPTRLFLRRLVLTKDDSAVKAYNLFLNAHTSRLLTLILLSIPFNLLCLYFVVIYTEIYSGSTGIWLNGIIMGLVIDNLFVQGVPVIALVVSRTLAKTFPNLQILYKATLNIKGLISAEILE